MCAGDLLFVAALGLATPAAANAVDPDGGIAHARAEPRPAAPQSASR
jgi:hypothetical protein